MTQIDQFNNQLSRRNNCIFRDRNFAIAFNIAIISRSEDIRYNERRNAFKVSRN